MTQTHSPLRTQGASALYRLRDYLNPLQFLSLVGELQGPEGDTTAHRLIAMAARIEHMPATYDQEHLGDEATAYLCYRAGGCSWHISEKGRVIEGEMIPAFGLADMGFPELGYISIDELVNQRVELDLDFEPRPLSAIREQLAAA